MNWICVTDSSIALSSGFEARTHLRHKFLYCKHNNTTWHIRINISYTFVSMHLIHIELGLLLRGCVKIMFDFSFRCKFRRESHAMESWNKAQSQMVVPFYLFASSQAQIKTDSKTTGPWWAFCLFTGLFIWVNAKLQLAKK